MPKLPDIEKELAALPDLPRQRAAPACGDLPARACGSAPIRRTMIGSSSSGSGTGIATIDGRSEAHRPLDRPVLQYDEERRDTVVKLRLMRMGKKKQPTYRVVAADCAFAPRRPVHRDRRSLQPPP